MALATLEKIQQKVRRITRTPSTAQLSDSDLNDYINTFVLYDFPTSARLFSLRTVLTFYTQPGVDVYDTNTTDPLNPLYNFKNKYNAVHPTAYIGGVAAFYTQYRDIFYGNWPQTNTITQTGLFGNGTNGPFVGMLPPAQNAPVIPYAQPHVLQRSVMFTLLDTSGSAMQIIDYPVSDTQGALGTPGAPQTLPSPYGDINYVTGAFTVLFPNATGINNNADGNPLWAEFINFAPGIPTTILYYDSKFTLRPVPDKSYVVQIEADMRPTELISTTDVPNLEQWWQWIALGASIKIFQDRMDMDSVNLLMPEFMAQGEMVRSTTSSQYTNDRTVTIYTNNGINNSWPNFGYWPY